MAKVSNSWINRILMMLYLHSKMVLKCESAFINCVLSVCSMVLLFRFSHFLFVRQYRLVLLEIVRAV